jgi:hypothetical protein
MGYGSSFMSGILSGGNLLEFSGPLIIYDPDDPQKDLYDVDDESTVITLADWYHNPAPQLTEQCVHIRYIVTR